MSVTASPSGSFRIGTWNLCAPPGGYLPGRLSAWTTRVDSVAAEVAESGVDILLAQEAGGVPEDEQYAEVFPPYVRDPANSYGGLAGVYGGLELLEVRLGALGFARSRHGSDGRWIFWRTADWSADDEHGAALPSGYWALDFGATRPRVVTYQALRHSGAGRIVLFVDPHLEYRQGEEWDAVRLAQTKAMLDGARQVADLIVPGSHQAAVNVVIAGDFAANKQLGNADPRGLQLRSAGFLDASEIAVVATNLGFTTARKWLGELDQWKSKKIAQHADQIWVDPTLTVAEWTQRLPVKGRAASDHNLVAAHVILPAD